MKILYTSAQVRNEIVRLFSTSRGRRVAITAFVGSGAESYLPKPEGLELICWPKAGGTNPRSLRQLIKRGVTVSFADALHMKVYWTEDKGAVLTSANLSTNALGSGNLREVGIAIPSGLLDVDRIISSLNYRSVTEKELLQLDKAAHAYHMGDRFDRAIPRSVSFAEWYQLPYRPHWKLGWWDTEGVVSTNAKKMAKEEYGVRSPREFLGCRQNDYQKNDWVVTFFLGSTTPTWIYWMAVDYVVRTAPSDKRAYEPDYPYQALQVWPLRRYPSPPFKIDKKFKAAFKQAVRGFGADRIKEMATTRPPKRLIEAIYANF